MKKLTVLILLVVFSSHIIFAQEDEQKIYKNEIKLNLLTSVLQFPEINYERILSDNSGLGIAVMFSLKGDEELQYMLLPYYRFYFGTKRVHGFFIEANTALIGFKENNYFSYVPAKSNHNNGETKLYFGFGFSVGYKYTIPKQGIVGETYFGLGRPNREDTVYPRIGITIGKQF